MSHVQSGGMTHTRVTSFKMVWLILGTKRCCGIDRIDVAVDVHVKVSHAMCISVTPL
jgi:hypothetical protein